MQKIAHYRTIRRRLAVSDARVFNPLLSASETQRLVEVDRNSIHVNGLKEGMKIRWGKKPHSPARIRPHNDDGASQSGAAGGYLQGVSLPLLRRQG